MDKTGLRILNCLYMVIRGMAIRTYPNYRNILIAMMALDDYHIYDFIL